MKLYRFPYINEKPFDSPVIVEPETLARYRNLTVSQVFSSQGKLTGFRLTQNNPQSRVEFILDLS